MSFFRRKAEDHSEEQLNLDYRLTFSSETGRRVLKDLQKKCHLLGPCYPDDVEFQLGERNVLLYILSRAQLPEERDKFIDEEVLDNG